MLDVGDDGVFHEPSARDRLGENALPSDSTEITYCNACNIVGEPLIAKNVDGVDITICEDSSECVSRFTPKDNENEFTYAY